MQFSALFLLALASLLSLANGDACVAGGPAVQVTAAKSCCLNQEGTWYQFYSVQAICVVDATKVGKYLACTAAIPGSDGKLDEKCIPGDGGLTPNPTSVTTTARITLTARAF